MLASSLRTVRVSAHDRLKRSFRRAFWLGVLTAAVAHFVVFIANPSLTIAVPDRVEPPIVDVVQLPDIDEPPPPEAFPRPKPPVLSNGIVGEIIPVSDRVFEPELVRDLQPPERATAAEEPFLGPSDVAPRIRDLARARDIVRAHYPAMLRDARVEGTATYWAYVDSVGRLVDVRLHTSSGYPALDAAGERALREIGAEVGFRPATNRDRAIPVWIRQAITFSVR